MHQFRCRINSTEEGSKNHSIVCNVYNIVHEIISQLFDILFNPLIFLNFWVSVSSTKHYLSFYFVFVKKDNKNISQDFLKICLSFEITYNYLSV